MTTSRLLSLLIILMSPTVATAELEALTLDHSHYYHLDFSSTNGEWHTGFADYLVGTEIDAEQDVEENAVFVLRDGMAMSGLKLHSNNFTSRTKMYVSRALSGLTPEQHYHAEIDVRFASNIGMDCMGIGASPGDVELKVGMTDYEPELEMDVETFMRLNVDLDAGEKESSHLLDLGKIGNDGVSNCDPSVYEFYIKALSSLPRYIEVQANQEGMAWITISTDSGFSGPTTLYLLDGVLKLRPINEKD